MGTQGSDKSPAIGPNNLGGPAMSGKMHGGGVKLQPKKENTGGGMDLNQRKMMAGDYSPTKSGVISGSHSKGGFMKHAKSSKGYAKTAKTMVKGPDGKMVPDYAVDGKGSGDLKKSSPGKYGHKKGPAKKKYIQDKESKIEGKAVRIIGSGSGKVLASRNKKEVGKKYKSSGPGNFGSGFGVSTTGSDKNKKENSSMSDAEKIKASKTKKEAAGNKKKAEGQADLKTAKETAFISRGSGEDSKLSTRKERRTAIRAARAKKRAGRKEARKARKKTVIKQKI